MIGIFVWAVMPSGLLFLLMFLSNNRLLMRVASTVLATPIRAGALQVSIAVLCTAISGIMALLFYGQLSRYEAKLETTTNFNFVYEMTTDRTQLKAVFAQRNFYIALVGLALWGTAWRLKELHDHGSLVVAPAARSKPLATKIVYIVVGLLALLASDIPLCRLNYNLQLAMNVTPQKTKLLTSYAGQCENVYKARATGPCQEFCTEVEALAGERLATILWARGWHPLGKAGAQVFDAGRGVEQGEGRVDGLFEKKTCVQVLKSVDKSNANINMLCIFFAVIGVMGGFSALSTAFEAAPRAVVVAGVPESNLKRD